MESKTSLYVLFNGQWGCDIELWFTGEVSYDASPQKSAEYIPEWLDSTLIIQNGFVYLIDDGDATVENARDGWRWFKARHLKYHVIPE